MENNKNKEELQSRREFFKSAAKAALPVIGAVVLANLPSIANADPQYGWGCTSACKGSCSGKCTSCTGSCYGSCMGGCKGYY